jgi:arginyl-tRNA synthetase
MTDPQTILHQRVRDAILAAFGPEHADVDPLLSPARNAQFGDYQSNLAMSLAKRLGSNPRAVATQIVQRLQLDDLCDIPADRSAMIAGPGFINLRLRADFVNRLASDLAADPRAGVAIAADPQRIVVDYSGPNVAKEMHVGHLRSTVIGDAIARVLQHLGHTVIRQNHLGDWGTQFGMLIEFLIDAGWQPAGHTPISDLNKLYQDAKRKFDADADFADRARRRVVQLQGGDESTLAIWRYLVDESTRHFQAIYHRLDVALTPSDIRPESFYNDKLAAVIDDLAAKNLTAISDGATVVFSDEFKTESDQPLPMIIKKGDGGYLYATTDLAALRYRLTELAARRLVYVTDARQKQHFAMVFSAARRAGWIGQGVELDHVPFGTVLGEDGKPFKTRSGDTVKLVDLLDEAQERAEAIVTAKSPDLPPEQREAIARIVGVGAVKYADLSSDRVKDYVFSWARMLAMEGNTAPYLQYAYARIRSIFRKAQDASSSAGPLTIEHPAERALVLKLVQFDATVRSVAASLEPHRLCNYLYELAAMFSTFYENCPVLKAEHPQQRATRLALCDMTARTLEQGLGLLGIGVIDRM